MEIGGCAVEELDQSSIDVPDLICCRGPDPDLRFWRMDSPPRSSQAMETNDPVPCRRGGKDLSEALGKDRQVPRRNVPVVLGSGHLFDDLELRRGDLVRMASWAGGDVFERACLLSSPRMVPARREAEDP